MKVGLAILLMTILTSSMAAAQGLKIYFLDMSGGGSTLIVTPAGESVLIDTGSLHPEHRDADRILAATEHAGLKQIDYLITTHFHLDHFGAIEEVARRIPVRVFMDKAAPPPRGEADSDWYRELAPLYQKATAGKTTTLRAGDDVPLRQAPGSPPLRLHVVAAEARVEGFDGDIDAPVAGAEIRPADESDNGRSIAMVLSFGDFRFFAGGDITWNVEHHLGSPSNRVGEVDLFQVQHHGMDYSNNPVLLKALNPTVAVSLNGPRKGIGKNSFATLMGLPGLEALYQMHFNVQNGTEGNTNSEWIANREGKEGRFVLATVAPDGESFSMQVGTDGTRRKFSVR